MQDDRDRAGSVLRGLSARSGSCDNDVRLEPHAVGNEGWKPLAPAIRGEVVDGDVLPIYIAQVSEALEERGKSGRLRRTWIERKDAQPGDLPRLRLGGERRGEKATSQGAEECASFQLGSFWPASSRRGRGGAASGTTLHHRGGRM